MMPKVDTFEHDISDEIRRKEASLTEISAASNNVGNNDDVELPRKAPIFLITIITFFVLSLAGFGVLGYFYYTDTLLTPQPSPATTQTGDTSKTNTTFEKISPTLAQNIGRFVTRVEKKDQGYIITVSDYSQVFAYMTRNENNYIEELATLFPPKNQVTSNTTTSSTTTTQASGQNNATTSTSTPASVKTNVASSTKEIQQNIEVPLEKVSTSNFSDITISNQNMRVWNSGTHSVVYAFIGNKAVVISSSQEGILYLKSVILK